MFQHRRWYIIAGLFTTVWIIAAGAFARDTPPDEGSGLPLSSIRLPQGFHIEVFARGVKGARSMALAPGGTVFVGTRDEGCVYAIAPDSRGKAVTIAAGLHQPNGVALKDGALYIAEISRIVKMQDAEKSIGKHHDVVPIAIALPSREEHGWRYIRFGPDGKLYVAVGMPCNICQPDDLRFGTILRCNPDGSSMEVFARGVRNSVGFDWQPGTHELWFTDNGRDWLGDNLPPDELNCAPRPGLHFGFPFCYGKGTPDPEHPRTDCSRYVPARLELGAHVASLGMRFYAGSMFPEYYRGGIFIAEHGSWNRSTPVGYRIMFVKLTNGMPSSYEVFAEGWLRGRTPWGRPVDVEIMPDGSLLVSDDMSGIIYRITYKGA